MIETEKLFIFDDYSAVFSGEFYVTQRSVIIKQYEIFTYYVHVRKPEVLKTGSEEMDG